MALTFTTQAVSVYVRVRRTIPPEISRSAHDMLARAQQIAAILTGLSASEDMIDRARDKLFDLGEQIAELTDRL